MAGHLVGPAQPPFAAPAGSSARGAVVPALLVLALIAVPLIELYVLIQVGQVIGAVPTLGLLLLVSVLGAALLRREGARSWRAFREATARGAVPACEVADGALIVLAGALLVTPGFVSDVFGLLLLLPPIRVLVRRPLTAYAMHRLLGRSGRAPRGRIVEGEVVDERVDE